MRVCGCGRQCLRTWSRFRSAATCDFWPWQRRATSRGHRCIRQRPASGKPYRWELARGTTAIEIDVPGMLTLDHIALMIDAAIDGLGIAFVPEPLAWSALRAGRLRALLEDWSPATPGLCLYYPGYRHVPATLRAFVDVLRLVDGSEKAGRDSRM